jgi:hypothetical protein
MDIQKLLDLRKITQAISRKFEADIRSHLTTLTPLFSPLNLFGEYVRGGSKPHGLRGEKAFRELTKRFKLVTEQGPFNLDSALTTPLDLFAATPVLTTMDYVYTARSEEGEYQIKVTSPFRWILSYPDATPKRVRELLTGDRNQSEVTLHHLLLQSIAMTILIEQQPGVTQLFQDLRFPLHVQQADDLGSLPIISLSAPLSTRLPEDQVIIQNTQLTGIPSFEEIVDISDIQQMSDPIREQLIALAQSQSPTLLREMTREENLSPYPA